MNVTGLRKAGGAPLYLALADRIADDIASGRLLPGAQLPPQRALARELGVDFTTITRAYAEAARRGLVVGQVGRGTFVRATRREPSVAPPVFSIPVSASRSGLDLALNLSPQIAADEAARALSRTLADLHRAGDLGGLLEYVPNAGRADHRAAGARWLERRTRAPVAPDCVVICAGAQHAMTSLLMTLAQPGDWVLTECLTYPGFLDLARRLGLRVAGVAMDREGLVPHALREACRSRKPRALFCMPTVQNPTGGIMTVARRREIEAIAEQHRVAIIEDDVYGVLPTRAPRALSTSYLIATLSKAVVPLRIAYVRAPDARAAERLADAVRTTVWAAPPLMAEIATRWMLDGTAAQLLGIVRQEMVARHAMARAVFGAKRVLGHPESLHIWIECSDSARLAARIRETGVAVIPSDVFAVSGAGAPSGLRISLSAAPSRDTLERALRLVSAQLD